MRQQDVLSLFVCGDLGGRYSCSRNCTPYNSKCTISENTGKFLLHDLAALTNGIYCTSQHGALIESIYCCIVNIRVIIVIVVSSCILVSRINKLKKWLFYIYLLTTITKALYQSSEKGMSLLFTCPQLTEERNSLLASAARMRLLSTTHVM